MQGTEAGIDAAKAAFLPKVYLAAVAAGGKSNLSAGGLPTIGQSASTSGVLVGMSVPIFNGGLRVAELRNAESVAAAGRATYRKTKDDAAREIVVSAETLRSALSSYQAATALVSAAAVTYDAAFESYKAGVGNVTEATAADSGLLAARQAQADAHAAALVAAANLAFMLGDMTSSEVATGLLRR
jgi:outer membrane protein TolC